MRLKKLTMVLEVDASLDVEAVFTKMKEASKTINRVAITADTKTTTTMSGVTSVESSTIDGKLQISPSVQHIINTATSGEATDGEMYVTEDATYFSTEDSGGWIKFNHRQNDGVVGVLQEEQLAHLIDYQDAFELAEDDTHFIITYIGADELYKEVFYSGPMRTKTIAGDLSAQIEKMEVTGSLTMMVSKETFFVDSQVSMTDVTMHDTIVIHTIDEATQTFTNYNQIDEVVVPEDIIENAISINPGA